MSTVVAGVDFGTLSVRVSLFDSQRGRLGSGTADYALHRKKEDPDYATQSHAAHMDALVLATGKALQSAQVDGQAVSSIALDTTGSSVIPVGKGLIPLDDSASQPLFPFPDRTSRARFPLSEKFGNIQQKQSQRQDR